MSNSNSDNDSEEFKRNHSAFVAEYESGKLKEGTWYIYHRGNNIASGEDEDAACEHPNAQAALRDGHPLLIQARADHNIPEVFSCT
jgi:hypothetical protein